MRPAVVLAHALRHTRAVSWVWAELTEEWAQRERAALEEAILGFWRNWSGTEVHSFAELPTPQGAGISLSRSGGRWCVRSHSRALRPLSELVQRGAPAELEVQLGLCASPFEEALERTRELTRVELALARVRVGLTRGHLLELVLSVPRDVTGSEEQLQIAAEVFFEHLVGDRLLDDWVASIDVARSGRSRGLVLVQETEEATTYPLQEAFSLIQRGVAGLTAGLPDTLLQAREETWTALDIPEAEEDALQPDRLFASTWLPEALKAALEGLPFHSGRFTRGSEIFLALSWESGSWESELRRRIKREREARVQSWGLSSGRGRLFGSGFGRKLDYLDVLIVPDGLAIRELIQELRSDGRELRLHFYDSIWANEALYFPARSGATRG